MGLVPCRVTQQHLRLSRLRRTLQALLMRGCGAAGGLQGSSYTMSVRQHGAQDCGQCGVGSLRGGPNEKGGV